MPPYITPHLIYQANLIIPYEWGVVNPVFPKSFGIFSFFLRNLHWLCQLIPSGQFQLPQSELFYAFVSCETVLSNFFAMRKFSSSSPSTGYQLGCYHLIPPPLKKPRAVREASTRRSSSPCRRASASRASQSDAATPRRWLSAAVYRQSQMSARLQVPKAQQMPLLLCHQGVAVQQTLGGDASGPVRPGLQFGRGIIPPQTVRMLPANSSCTAGDPRPQTDANP